MAATKKKADHKTLLLRLAKANEGKRKKALRAERKLQRAGMARKPLAGTSLDKSAYKTHGDAKEVQNKKGGKRVVRFKKTGGSGTSSTALKVDKSTPVGRKLMKDAGLLKPTRKAKAKSAGPGKAKQEAQAKASERARARVMKLANKKGGRKKLTPGQRRQADAITKQALANQPKRQRGGGQAAADNFMSPFVAM